MNISKKEDPLHKTNYSPKNILPIVCRAGGGNGLGGVIPPNFS